MLLAIASMVVIAVCGGCSTNKDLVAKATADHTYYEYRYMLKCQNGHEVQGCGPCSQALNRGTREIQVANTVYKLGYMPEPEKKSLQELIAALEACP